MGRVYVLLKEIASEDECIIFTTISVVLLLRRTFHVFGNVIKLLSILM